MGKQRRPHVAVRKRVAAQIEARLAGVAELLVNVDYELEQLQRLAMENGLDLTVSGLEEAMDRLSAHERMDGLLSVDERDLESERERREERRKFREMLKEDPGLAEALAEFKQAIAGL